MLFIYYPKCSTCRKAKQALDTLGLAYTERDIVKDPPTAEELKEWHRASKLDLGRFFNTSGQVYRALGLAKKRPQMTEADQYDLLASNGMLVKRPILVTSSGQVLLGFKPKEYQALVD